MGLGCFHWSREDCVRPDRMYKIMRGMDRVDREQLFPFIEGSVARGHKFNVRGGRFRGDLRKIFFTQRVVTIWNALSGRVVEAGCLTSFKKYLDEYLARHNIQGYGPSVDKWDEVGRSGPFMRWCRLDGPKGLFCTVVFCDSDSPHPSGCSSRVSLVIECNETVCL